MKRVLLVLFLTFVHGVALAEDPSFRHIRLGDPYPQFCAQQYSGGQFCSDKLNGKIVILSFFRIDQQLSQRNMIRLQEIYAEYRSRNVTVVVAIASGKVTQQELTVFLQENTIEFPVLLDPDRRLYSLFGVIASPSTGVFAADKTMRYFVASKWINYKKYLDAHLRLLLKDITADEHKKIMHSHDETVAPEKRKALNNYNLAKVLFEGGNIIKATEILNLSMKGFPDHAPTYVLYGKIAIQQQDYARALTFFDKALELNPSLEDARNGRQTSLEYLSKN